MLCLLEPSTCEADSLSCLSIGRSLWLIALKPEAVLLPKMTHMRSVGMRLPGVAGAGKAVVATDVMWSDPAAEPGLVENDARGVGLLFGPDVTQVC